MIDQLNVIRYQKRETQGNKLKEKEGQGQPSKAMVGKESQINDGAGKFSRPDDRGKRAKHSNHKVSQHQPGNEGLAAHVGKASCQSRKHQDHRQ